MAEEKSGTAMPGAHFPGSQHPPEWREDLNPQAPQSPAELSGATPPLHPADIEESHDKLPGLTNHELAEIPVVREGEHLQQGSNYIDLAARQPAELTAMAGTTAASHNWYVPKREVGYVLWNKLIGVENPARLDQEG
jgi:hypothetical protein